MSYKNYETNYLISLLSSILNKRTPPDPAYAIDWRELFYLAEFHDVTNIAGYALIALYDQVPEMWKARFNKIFRKWVTVDNTQQKEFRGISDALEDESIPFMVMRCWMMKRYYPQMDMRAVDDIGLLVKPGYEKRLKEVMRELGYRLIKVDDHGMMTYQKGLDCRICLYDKILPENRKLKSYFTKIWKKLEPIGGFSSRHSLEIDDFYIYMIAEICDRYARGDVDVRDILDIHLFVKRFDLELNWTYIEGELNKLELSKMAKYLEDLGRMWVGVYEGNERSICEAVEDYVWSKGASGRETSIRLLPMITDIELWEIRDQRKKRFHEVMRWLFPKSEEMLGFFPTLAKVKVLMPVLWILRLIHMGLHSIKLRIVHFHRSLELRRREKQKGKQGKDTAEESARQPVVQPLYTAPPHEAAEEEMPPDGETEAIKAEALPEEDRETTVPDVLKSVQPVDVSTISKIAQSFNAVRISTIAEIQSILKHDKHSASEPEEDRLIDHGKKEDEQFRMVGKINIPEEEEEEEELVDPMWVAKTTTNPNPAQEPKVIRRWKPTEIIHTEPGEEPDSKIVRPWKASEGLRQEYTEEDVEAAKAYVTSPNRFSADSGEEAAQEPAPAPSMAQMSTPPPSSGQAPGPILTPAPEPMDQKPKPAPVEAIDQKPKPAPVEAVIQKPEPAPVEALDQKPKPAPVEAVIQKPKQTPSEAMDQKPKQTPSEALDLKPVPAPAASQIPAMASTVSSVSKVEPVSTLAGSASQKPIPRDAVSSTMSADEATKKSAAPKASKSSSASAGTAKASRSTKKSEGEKAKAEKRGAAGSKGKAVKNEAVAGKSEAVEDADSLENTAKTTKSSAEDADKKPKTSKTARMAKTDETKKATTRAKKSVKPAAGEEPAEDAGASVKAGKTTKAAAGTKKPSARTKASAKASSKSTEDKVPKTKTVSKASRTTKKTVSDAEGNPLQDESEKAVKAPKKRLLVDDFPLEARNGAEESQD